MKKTPLQKAIEFANGQTELASKVGVTKQAVNQWLTKGVPAIRVIQIEKAVGGKVTRYELRPDLYPKN